MSSRTQLVVAALLALLAIVICLVDIFLFPGLYGPAVFYVVPVIVAAYCLHSPRMVASVALWTIALQIAAYLQEGAGLTLLPMSYVLGLTLMSALSALLTDRVRRETHIRADLEVAMHELAARHKELQSQSEEIEAQSEELQAQNEELQSQNQELQVQEEELRLLAEERATIIESIADAVFVCDRRGVITQANRAGLDLIGTSELGSTRTLSDYLKALHLRFPDGRPVPLEDLAISRAVGGETTLGREEVGRHPLTGAGVDLLVSAAPLHDEAGRAVGAVEVAVDVTRMRESEAERERLLKDLGAHRQLLQMVVDDVPAGIAVFRGPNFVFEEANPTYRQFAPGKDMVGRTYAEVWPETVGELAPILRKVLETGEPFHTADALVPIQRSPGAPLEDAYWTFSLMRLPPDESGQAGILNTAIETTEQVRARQRQEQLLAAAQESRSLAESMARAREEFISVAAHELKTPVTSLLGYSQLTLRELGKTGTAEPRRLARSMEQIERQSRRLATLTERLLDLSRLEAGKLALAREDADVAALVENVVAAARLSHPGRTIELRKGQDARAFVDVIRLEQVVTNLIDNALKFSPDDSPVETEVSMDDRGWVKIAVRDHGMGIPADKRGQVFEKFYQAHEERRYGGMGIGLFVSREIVEMHDGSIRVEQPEDGGTRFIVNVPPVPSEGQPPEVSSRPASLPGLL